MAWNPDPKVAAAREFGRKFGKDVVVILRSFSAPCNITVFGRKFGKDVVVILSMNTAKGTIEYASYGETKGLCSTARKLADVAFEAVMREWQ